MWETNNLFAILDSIYSLFLLEEIPFQFRHTFDWTLIWRWSLSFPLPGDQRWENCWSTPRVWRGCGEGSQGGSKKRFRSDTTREAACFCMFRCFWLGKSTNSTRSRKSCSAEKISWVPTDSESCQHLPWILLVDTSKYYQAVGFQKGWTISMRCIIIIVISFLYATILLLVHVIDMRFASRVSMKER